VLLTLAAPQNDGGPLRKQITSPVLSSFFCVSAPYPLFWDDCRLSLHILFTSWAKEILNVLHYIVGTQQHDRFPQQTSLSQLFCSNYSAFVRI